ncbi:DUF1697 domain-containing protein [Streptococcus ictaluri]|uniref:PF08002 family protein n=1 Tax=Streptococcus ictaluri 707-05 TaxID=764299 RepID=G5K3I3_9STRE|nr:DUF1697 domain-containing protein [Streptococcus ictaluri]EHI69552.1 hypothetical protein STRIC_1352 [Streptococcus ictaluri 707-05]
MDRYIALLRGININGKNKIPMSELKEAFHSLNYFDIKTYLNTGNVVFPSRETDINTLISQIEMMIKTNFGLTIPVFPISVKDLEAILECAPPWWGTADKAIYDNIIFIIPPATFREVFEVLGQPKIELEKIQNEKNDIFGLLIVKSIKRPSGGHEP